MTSSSSASSPRDLFAPSDPADLLAIARALYPHDGLGPEPYERSVSSLLELGSRTPRLFSVLTDGLAELRAVVGVPLDEVAAEELRELLRAREAGAFFTEVRAYVAFTLYDDHQVWEHIGYPGASFELGGYLHRGFDDLDWLPEPRVEESGEPAIELGPLPYLAGEAALTQGVLR